MESHATSLTVSSMIDDSVRVDTGRRKGANLILKRRLGAKIDFLNIPQKASTYMKALDMRAVYSFEGRSEIRFAYLRAGDYCLRRQWHFQEKGESS